MKLSVFLLDINKENPSSNGKKPRMWTSPKYNKYLLQNSDDRQNFLSNQ